MPSRSTKQESLCYLIHRVANNPKKEETQMKISVNRTTAILSVVLLLACASQVFALTTGETVVGTNGVSSYPGLHIVSVTRSYDASLNQYSMTLAAPPGIDYFSGFVSAYKYTIMMSPNVPGAVDAYYNTPISTNPGTPTDPGGYFNRFAAGSPAYEFSVTIPLGPGPITGSYSIWNGVSNGNPASIPGYNFTATGNVLTWTIPKSGVYFPEFAWLGITSVDSSFDGITNGTNFAVVSAPPVPIPGAVWLFGSGLIGLVGIGRKRFKR
jgi:hypothetical protein